MIKNNREITLIDKSLITASSNISTYSTNIPALILDDSEDTLFHSNQFQTGGYGDVYFKFETSRSINKIEFLTRHPSQGNGRIEQYEVLYKNRSFDAEWISVFKSEVETINGWREANFEDILASEICIRVHRSYGNWIVMNDIKIYSSSEAESDLLQIFYDLECTGVKTDINLFEITSLKDKYLGNTHFENILNLGKFLWLNKNNAAKKNIKLLKYNISSEEFSETLKIEPSGRLRHLGLTLTLKNEIVIISSSDLNIYIKDDIIGETKKIIEIKSGFNLVYSKNICGDMFVDELLEDLNLVVYNGLSATYFTLGKDTYEDFIQKNESSTKAYIEGKNFVAYLNLKWLKENFSNFDFVQGMENLDTVLDYTYFLINRNEYFYETPTKRFICEGSLLDRVIKQDISEVGSYTSFSGIPNLMFSKNIETLVSPNFCRVISKELVLKTYFSEDIHEALTLILAKELEFRYSRVLVIPEDKKSAVWLKLRLFSDTNRFITRIFKKIQKIGFNESETAINTMVKWISEILERDASKYFLMAGYALSNETVQYCSYYPEFALNLDDISFTNYKTFIENEIKIINENYKANQTRKA